MVVVFLLIEKNNNLCSGLVYIKYTICTLSYERHYAIHEIEQETMPVQKPCRVIYIIITNQ